MNTSSMSAFPALQPVGRGGAIAPSGGAECPHKPEQKLEQLMQLLLQLLAEKSGGVASQGAGPATGACAGPSGGGAASGQPSDDMVQQLLDQVTQELRDREARQCHLCKPHEVSADAAALGGKAAPQEPVAKTAAAELA